MGKLFFQSGNIQLICLAYLTDCPKICK